MMSLKTNKIEQLYFILDSLELIIGMNSRLNVGSRGVSNKVYGFKEYMVVYTDAARLLQLFFYNNLFPSLTV